MRKLKLVSGRGGRAYVGGGVAGGDQGRWNWPGGRLRKGLGKRSGVEISLEGSRWGESGCGGGGGGVRGGSSKSLGRRP